MHVVIFGNCYKTFIFHPENLVRVVFKQWSELPLKSGYNWPKSGLILH
jgi:hypothetical protein